MIDLLLPAVLVVGIVTLAIAISTLRSSRRSENIGEDRYELLRDQRDRLDMLREERRMLAEELERESRERRQLTEYLEETDPRLVEHLKRRRQARTGSEHEDERLEEERRRLEQEHRQLREELEQERRKRL
jgi:predicted RNase H-like nuclease (RuvC/YqgF family)